MLDSSISQANGASGPTNEQQQIPAKVSAQLDLVVWLHLYFWPALTLAIQNGWGGSPQVSSDKRDWLAGQVSEMLANNELEDVGDLEDVLVQVMLDEFDVVVDDDTQAHTAKKIWSGVAKIREGNTDDLHELYIKWQEKEQKGGFKVQGEQMPDQEGAETDDDEDDEGEEWNGFSDGVDTGGDVAMDEAPALVDSRKPKPEPEIDEEGFTKVVPKRKR